MTSTSPTSAADEDVVLVADLDGTLCRTDTLHEALLALAGRDPAALLRLPGWLREGRAGLKARLAETGPVDAGALPLNEKVIAVLRDARAAGRRTALVSAADARQVAAVAEATGLFDEAHGSRPGHNLKGPAKAALLTERFGAKGFDYIGDARADLPVWSAARRAVTVSADASLRRSVEAANSEALHISPPGDRAGAMLHALRPHQWSKNLLVFLPALAAHDPGRLAAAALGFLAFCLVASAVYVINDLLDLAADRAHPRKRTRPFAAGDLTALDGAGLAAALLLGGFGTAALKGSGTFAGALALYFAATLAYSAWLKHRLLIDVITLGGLYTLRIVGGGAAAAVTLSPWMLGFSMFLFLGLAAVKRQAELADRLATGRAGPGRAYEPDDLPVLRGLAIAAAMAAVLVLALYISSDEVQALYPRPYLLWLICPILLYWTLRMVMKTHRGLMTDDPIVYAVSDAVSLTLIGIAVAIAAAAALLPPL